MPFAVWIALLALQPFAVSLPNLAVDPGWGYAVRTAVVLAIVALLWSRYVELRPAARLRFIPLLEAALVGLAVFVAWITLGPLFRIGGGDEHLLVRKGDGTLDLVWVAFRIAGSALVIPVVEELFWRSWLMRRLDSPRFLELAPQHASWQAIWFSSAVFALEHREYAAGLLAGIAYAWLYRRHGDLRLSVIAHAVTNATLAAYVLADARYEFW